MNSHHPLRAAWIAGCIAAATSAGAEVPPPSRYETFQVAIRGWDWLENVIPTNDGMLAATGNEFIRLAEDGTEMWRKPRPDLWLIESLSTVDADDRACFALGLPPTVIVRLTESGQSETWDLPIAGIEPESFLDIAALQDR
jgi:hypothetical protein